MGILAPASVFPNEDHSLKLEKFALAFWRPDPSSKAEMGRTSRGSLLEPPMPTFLGLWPYHSNLCLCLDTVFIPLS